MSRYCLLNDVQTCCTENCKECAKEIYADLKEKTGKAEFVTEEAIINDLGQGSFEMLKKHGHIEFCGILQGRRMYAV